ncbi:zinc finger protein NUTCRACKER-like [Phalaenopsis equestris]|uniref:zinc finger protein NUTCRACKER-like n=1 Tax=Phalaenopsis equestris TaxID=78828 RepID=UPI0009E55D94|nr:zinc finger protein NUTCRACKER-like [Phalaenopsis equestris]
MATNRFLCEICGKGFQRDQNLQLHRRGHNLPWKLRQKSSKEPRKRVYVCPEKTCIHHNPLRALGDLTGIKKHFCRKHGEKKWKCDKCSKRYAVQSDWKAHAKVCGTREYRCDCGTIFSRRDSFITHRAFCDALAEEAARISAASNINNPASMTNIMNYPYFNENLTRPNLQPLPASGLSFWMNQDTNEGMVLPNLSPFNSAFLSCSNSEQLDCQLNWIYNESKLPDQNLSFKDSCNNSSLGSMPFLFSTQQERRMMPEQAPEMSATTLLQKAAQMGVVSSGGPSVLAGLDMKSSLVGELLEGSHYSIQMYDIGGGRDGGGEITRDFLGVGVQALCPSSVTGWI